MMASKVLPEKDGSPENSDFKSTQKKNSTSKFDLVPNDPISVRVWNGSGKVWQISRDLGNGMREVYDYRRDDIENKAKKTLEPKATLLRDTEIKLRGPSVVLATVKHDFDPTVGDDFAHFLEVVKENEPWCYTENTSVPSNFMDSARETNEIRIGNTKESRKRQHSDIVFTNDIPSTRTALEKVCYDLQQEKLCASSNNGDQKKTLLKFDEANERLNLLWKKMKNGQHFNRVSLLEDKSILLPLPAFIELCRKWFSTVSTEEAPDEMFKPKDGLYGKIQKLLAKCQADDDLTTTHQTKNLGGDIMNDVSIIRHFSSDMIENLSGLFRDPSMVGASGSSLIEPDDVRDVNGCIPGQWLNDSRRNFIVTDTMLQQYISGGAIAQFRTEKAIIGRQPFAKAGGGGTHVPRYKGFLTVGSSQIRESPNPPVDESTLFPMIELKLGNARPPISRSTTRFVEQCYRADFSLKIANVVGYLEHVIQRSVRFQCESLTAQVKIHRNLKDSTLPSDIRREKGDGLSSKYCIPNNDTSEEYDHPRAWNMNFPLRPEQLRSLGWLMNRERGHVGYSVDIKRYSPGNLFLNEQSVCPKESETVIGSGKVNLTLHSNFNDRRLVSLLHPGVTLPVQLFSKTPSLSTSKTPILGSSENCFQKEKEEKKEFERSLINWCVEYNLKLKYKLRGGLLCDKPGHGKTATTIALILHGLEKPFRLIGDNYYSRKKLRKGIDQMVKDGQDSGANRNVDRSPKGSQQHENKDPSEGFVLEPGMFSCPNTTLIIVPQRLVGQWAQEFKKLTGRDDYPKILVIRNFRMFRRLRVIDIEQAHVLLVPYPVLFHSEYQDRFQTLLGLPVRRHLDMERLRNPKFEHESRPAWNKDVPNAHLLKLATEEFIQDSLKKAQVWWRKKEEALSEKCADPMCPLCAGKKATTIEDQKKIEEQKKASAKYEWRGLSKGGQLEYENKSPNEKLDKATVLGKDGEENDGRKKGKKNRSEFEIRDTSRTGRRFFRYWETLRQSKSTFGSNNASSIQQTVTDTDSERVVSSDSCFESGIDSDNDLMNEPRKQGDAREVDSTTGEGHGDAAGYDGEDHDDGVRNDENEDEKPAKKAKLSAQSSIRQAIHLQNPDGASNADLKKKLSKKQQQERNARRKARKAKREEATRNAEMNPDMAFPMRNSTNMIGNAMNNMIGKIVNVSGVNGNSMNMKGSGVNGSMLFGGMNSMNSLNSSSNSSESSSENSLGGIHNGNSLGNGKNVVLKGEGSVKDLEKKLGTKIHGITEELRKKLYFVEQTHLKKCKSGGNYYRSVRSFQQKYRRCGFPNFHLWGYPVDVCNYGTREDRYLDNCYLAVIDPRRWTSERASNLKSSSDHPYNYSKSDPFSPAYDPNEEGLYCPSYLPYGDIRYHDCQFGGMYNIFEAHKIVENPYHKDIDWEEPFCDPAHFRFPVLEQIKFGRIVFDEFHEAESFKDMEVHRLCNLNAHSRIGLTGTPSVNNSMSIIGSASILQLDFLAQDPESVLLYNNLSYCAKKNYPLLEDKDKTNAEVIGDIEENDRTKVIQQRRELEACKNSDEDYSDRFGKTVFAKDFRNVTLEHYDVYPNLLWGKAITRTLLDVGTKRSIISIAEEQEFRKWRNQYSFPVICPPEIIHKGEVNQSDELAKTKRKSNVTLPKASGKANLIVDLKKLCGSSSTGSSDVAESSNGQETCINTSTEKATIPPFLPYMCNFCGGICYIDLHTQQDEFHPDIQKDQLKLDFRCYICNNRNLTKDLLARESQKSVVHNTKFGWGNIGSRGYSIGLSSSFEWNSTSRGGSNYPQSCSNTTDELSTVLRGDSFEERMKILSSLKLDYRSMAKQRNEFLSVHSWERSSSISNECNRFVMNMMRQSSIAGIEDDIQLVEKIVAVKLTPFERLLYKNKENEVTYGSEMVDEDTEKNIEKLELCEVGLFNGNPVIPEYDPEKQEKKTHGFGLFSSTNDIIMSDMTKPLDLHTKTYDDRANSEINPPVSTSLNNGGTNIISSKKKATTTTIRIAHHASRATADLFGEQYMMNWPANLTDAELKKRTTLLKSCCHFRYALPNGPSDWHPNDPGLRLNPEEEFERVKKEKHTQTERKLLGIKETLIKMEIYKRAIQVFMNEEILEYMPQEVKVRIPIMFQNLKLLEPERIYEILRKNFDPKIKYVARKSRFQKMEDEEYERIRRVLGFSLEDLSQKRSLDLVFEAYGNRNSSFCCDLQHYLRRDLLIQEMDRENMGAEDEYSHKERAAEIIQANSIPFVNPGFIANPDFIAPDFIANMMPPSIIKSVLHDDPPKNHEEIKALIGHRIEILLADASRHFGRIYQWCFQIQSQYFEKVAHQNMQLERDVASFSKKYNIQYQRVGPVHETCISRIFHGRPEAFVEGWGLDDAMEACTAAKNREILQARKTGGQQELAEQKDQKIPSLGAACVRCGGIGDFVQINYDNDDGDNDGEETDDEKASDDQNVVGRDQDDAADLGEIKSAKKSPNIEKYKTMIDIRNKKLREHFEADLLAFSELNLRAELERKIQQTLTSLEGEFAFERLRQVSAGNLSLFKSKYGDRLDSSDYGNNDEKETLECSICMCDFLPEDMRIIERCSHTFCEGCLADLVKTVKHCSICRCPCPDVQNSTSNLGEVLASYKKLDPEMKNKLKEGSNEIRKSQDGGSGKALAEDGDLEGSTKDVDSKKSWLVREAVDLSVYEEREKKIQWHGSKCYSIVTTLEKIFTEDCTARVIIFVQFNDLKARIGKALADYRFRFVTTEESRPDYFRCTQSGTSALVNFQGAVNQSILLLSMDREEAFGSNLTTASHVLLVHPMCAATAHMAFIYESQAIARVRRMGQTRSKVFVWRFVTENTIEQELVVEHRAEIHLRKQLREAHMQKVDQKLKQEEKRYVTSPQVGSQQDPDRGRGNNMNDMNRGINLSTDGNNNMVNMTGSNVNENKMTFGGASSSGIHGIEASSSSASANASSSGVNDLNGL